MSTTNPSGKPTLITLAELSTWLDGLAKRITLVAPRNVENVILYRKVEGSEDVAEGFPRPVLSAKEIFFPPTERLLSIEKKGGSVHVSETLPEGEVVLFGVRPCDARGVRLLDALFLEMPPSDPYYERRRKNTTLIGLACQEMGPTCFCTSTGSAPDDPTGVDLMLYPADGGYLAEAITDKGYHLLSEAGWEGTVSGGKAVPEGKRYPVPAKEQWPGHFNDEYWMKMAERCLSCRACAYACPTCRCFAVRDELLSPGLYERIRCWDGCTGENYRRVAGGHQPRPEKGERLRNRFYCKFYYLPGQIGLNETSACTGCGRCIKVCPAGVDITEVLEDLEELA